MRLEISIRELDLDYAIVVLDSSLGFQTFDAQELDARGVLVIEGIEYILCTHSWGHRKIRSIVFDIEQAMYVHNFTYMQSLKKRLSNVVTQLKGCLETTNKTQ
jgi:hypothetical protein